MTRFQPLGCFIPLLALASILAGLVASHTTRGILGMGTLTAIAVLAILPFVARREEPLERVRAPLTIAATALPIASASFVDASARAITPENGFGPGAVSLQVVLVTVVPFITLVTVSMTGAIARSIAAGSSPRRASIVRVLAWSALAAGAALVALALARAGRPTAQGYIASLPVVGRIQGAFEPPARLEGDAQRAAQILRPDDGSSCDGFFIADPRAGLTALEHVSFYRCNRVVVRRAHSGLLLMEDIAGHIVGVRSPRDELVAWVGPLHVRGEIRPPDAATGLALAGVLAATALLLRRRRSTLPDDPTRARDAILREGELCFDDDERLPAPAGTNLANGPVVAIFAASAPSFREHAGPVVERVLRGAIAEHRVAERAAAHALALALAAVASAPLAGALLVYR